jgi:DNA repair protein RecO (recombination protein O)
VSAKPAQFDDALCLRHWDWSETSQTGVLFTRGSGLVRVLAKGSKRPGSAYSGGLEILTRARAGLIARPASELALLTEWDIIGTYPGLRRSLPAFHAGLYIAEIVVAVVRDQDVHAALYDATVKALDEIARAKSPEPSLLAWQWAVIVEAGYRPELFSDIATGEPLTIDASRAADANGPLGFRPEAGGFLRLRDPETGFTGGPGGPTWRVRARTLEVLRGLDGETGGGAAPAAATEDELDRANRLLASYLRFVLGEQPVTMPMVFAGPLLR